MTRSLYVGGAALLLVMGCKQDYNVKEGIPVIRMSADTLDFGEVVVGKWAEMGVYVYNDGWAPLVVDAVELDSSTSADFELGGLDPMTLDPGDQGVLTARYTPDIVGQDWGNVVISTNDEENPVTNLGLLGFGVEPHIDVDPETLWFGTLDVGDTKTLSFEIGASGTGTTWIQTLELEDDLGVFTVDVPPDVLLPYALSPGFSLEVDVTFAPTDGAVADTNVLIGSNDPLQPSAAVRLLGNSEDNPSGNTAPQVEITSPNWGNYYVYGEPVGLEGSAVDLEDGPEALTCGWYAMGATTEILGTTSPDATGYLALISNDLPVGDVTVALRCMDMEGLMGEDSVDVTVWDREEPIRYIISGGDTVYDYWSVDDDVVIEVDGVEVLRDLNRTQDNHPPVEFEAAVGSVIHIVATDVNYCAAQLSALVLHFGTGATQPLNDAFCASACSTDPCYDPDYGGPWSNDFLDEEYTIEIP